MTDIEPTVHYESPEEIQAREEAARRGKSRRNAIIVSVVAHIVLGIMAVWIVAMTLPEKEEVAFVAPPPPRPRLEPRKLEMKVRVNQLTKKSSRPKLQPRMMVDAPTDLNLPEIKTQPREVQSKMQRTFSTMGSPGFGSGVGGGFGTGTGGGMGGMGLPPAIRDRCSAAKRTERLRKSGGRLSSEKAVQDALGWLKSQQNENGSYGERFPVAMTGLVVLAYLGHCETPDSPLYGDTVKRALDYLVSRSGGPESLMASGGGHGACYEHGIATYALGEAYIMTGNPAYRGPFVNGIRKILRAQNQDGGWVYAMNGGSDDGDTSVSGWQIQALKSAYLANLQDVEGVEKALDRAIVNMKRVYSEPQRTFGYRKPNDGNDRLNGVGVFAMSMWKNQHADEVRGGVSRILDDMEGDRFSEKGKMSYQRASLYGLYYNVQAMFAVGGRDWRKFNHWFQYALSSAQNKAGNWPTTRSKVGHAGGGGELHGGAPRDFEIYRTAICTLMLEVYYRYLPVVDI